MYYSLFECCCKFYISKVLLTITFHLLLILQRQKNNTKIIKMLNVFC